MTSRTTSAARSGAPSSGVRRNLFHHHLSRRPTAASSTATSTTTIQPSPDDQSADIVIRDKNGDYEVEVPPTLVEKQEDLLEKEKEDARLAEAVKHHCRDRNRTPSEPAELLAAVQASLRNKAASLQEDNWMYEAEEDL